MVMALYIQLQLYCANAELSPHNATRARGERSKEKSIRRKMASFKLLGKISMIFQYVLNILHIRKVVTQALYCIADYPQKSQHCHIKYYSTKCIYVSYIQYMFKSVSCVQSPI